jgi:uncharacterized protein YyaL (SSP411 family)
MRVVSSSSHARTPNRLAREASPYLQQHAGNPVDWYPWGEEALEVAKREDKPILLSIGYSACHWCHVMERESFEDEATAARMNDGYVCIKVDREERPDLDQIYQLVVQLMGRSGGWPLTVFLTPDQKPFFGGTYFPPVDKYGMPGFPKILAAVLEAFRTKRGEIDEQAAEITQAIATASDPDQREARGGPVAITSVLLADAAQRLQGRFDDTSGGFGSRPKFPSTMALAVMLRHGVVNRDERALQRVVFALDRMRAGGIYDQLGGGFHRYSTDEKWLVPHFEKMLYDNALLLRLYVDAWRATKHARFADTAREIAEYVQREMTHEGGAFFSTQDADSEGEEGKFFVWTPAEVRAVLGEDAELAMARWGVTDEGNFEETGATVLHEAAKVADLAVRFEKAPSEIEAALARARTRLREAREKRVKPFRDEKVLACWNGLMIGALADAGAALGDDAMIARAARALAFVKGTMITGDALNRVAKDGAIKNSPAFLDDHAYLADAALDLYEATGDLAHLAFARRLAERIATRFWDRAAQAFFFTPEGGEALIHRAKDPFDHATPSATAIACKMFLRLPATPPPAREGEPPYAKIAAIQLEALAAAAIENPFGMSEALLAMDRLARGEVTIVIAGGRDDARTKALARVAHETFVASRDLVWLDGEHARGAFAGLAEGKSAAQDGGARAYVCRGQTCSLPVGTGGELEGLLA